MILQTDRRFWDLFRFFYDYGCYVMSLVFMANKHAGTLISIEQIVQWAREWTEKNYLGEKLYVQRPVAMLRDMGLEVKSFRHADGREQPRRNEIEILKFQLARPETNGWWNHFVTGDGKGHVAYDPWGVSQTATKGELVGRRIFGL